LAKTLMVQTVAQALDLKFSAFSSPRSHAFRHHRHGDHRGGLGSGKRAFRFVRGPVFANIVLADEVNRTPPKTQAALLQAMQEHQ
jgi:MoxR-like ATPase